MKIYVAAGHTPSGTAGCGATGRLNESNCTREIAPLVVNYLKANGQNAKYGVFNRGNSYNLEDCYVRPQEANNWGADLYVEIHLNAGGGRGSEVEISGFGGKAEQYANRISSNVANALGIPNRGVHKMNLIVLNRTNMPAVLVECCFVDSNDANVYNANKIAKAIAEGILGHSINGASPSKTVVNNSSNHSNSNNREVYFDMSKKFINGSTIEKIWSNNLHEIQTGYLDPHEECKCIGIHSSGHGIVMYTATNGYDKIGFTTCHVKLCSDGIVRPID